MNDNIVLRFSVCGERFVVLRFGSEKACRDAGKIGIEGKEYVVQDGDIMHFLFNV